MSTGRQIFEQNILDFLNQTCADCHSNPADIHGAPDFLDTIEGQYYESLVARPDFVGCAVERSLLLTKGLDPNHPGKQLTDPQYGEMRAWLAQEAIDRFQGECAGPGGDDPGPIVDDPGPVTTSPPTTAVMEAIAQFGKCMTLEDWTNYGMPEIGNTIANDGAIDYPCYSCHDSNEHAAGNWMSDPNKGDADIKLAFDNMRKAYSIFHLVTATSNQDNSFKDIVPSNRWRDKGKDVGHPRYTLSQSSLNSMEMWFVATYEAWKSGSCSP